MVPRLLSCYSSGDRRFSALFARLPAGYAGETSRTIEQVYQGAKRDWRGQPIAQPKGTRPALLWIERGLYVCSNGFRHAFYTSLWDLYLREYPACSPRPVLTTAFMRDLTMRCSGQRRAGHLGRGGHRRLRVRELVIRPSRLPTSSIIAIPP